jgi:hypothetical protein
MQVVSHVKSMDQLSSPETNILEKSEEFPRALRRSKLYDHFFKSLSQVLLL